MNVSRETVPSSKNPFLEHIIESSPINNWLRTSNKNGSSFDLYNVHMSLFTEFVSFLLAGTPNIIVLSVEDGIPLTPIYNDLSAITKKPIAFFPPVNITDDLSETLFYSETDRFRQKAVELLLNNNVSIVLLSNNLKHVSSVLPESVKKDLLSLIVGGVYKLSDLKGKLSSWKYERVQTTALPGQFSVRGGIVDIFPISHQYPSRIEFEGNTISSIRSFDPISQISLNTKFLKSLRLFPFVKISSQTSIFSLIPKTAFFLNIKSTPDSSIINILADKQQGNNKIIYDLQCSPVLSKYQNFLRSKEIIRHDIVNQKHKVFICTENEGQIDFLKERVGSEPIYFVGPYSGGFSSNFLRTSLYTYHSIVGKPKKRLSPWALKNVSQAKISLFDDFEWEEILVHEDFGICKYKGINTLETSWGLKESIVLEFDGGGKVYVPTENISIVHKFIGAGKGAPPLSRLGSSKWDRQKQNTKKSAEKVVAEFISLYAKRQIEEGFQFSGDSSLSLDLENSFPYEETEDQRKAIVEINMDMQSKRPMDRLLCGDVGFGKTEVAIRATFKAIYDKKQVAVLVPTTILADQHYITFLDRFSPFGIRVEILSRFKSKSEQKKVLDKLKCGEIDLIIGTHRLLSKDIIYFDLGLLVVDEEHRFGAKQKEKIKQIKSNVDVLSMTATPIPRTLQLSLIGVRDVSKIETPPLERLPIITRIARSSDEVISQAILAEISRKGQVFFVHNKVSNIISVTENLKTLLPGIKFSYAHGQMDANDLEQAMMDFQKRKIDVLVCTTIIEAGIDLPNVNTIIINDSHNFGLAQLYQMRGRVGRSSRQAYCFLLLPSRYKVSAEVHTRLKTIETYSTLGSGYYIALKDLEMRGAGNIFGVEQSGHINSVGLTVFNKLIKESIAENNGEQVNKKYKVEVSIEGDSLIPKNYMPDISNRLVFYRRLGSATTAKDILAIEKEMRDRFGPTPQPLLNLITSSLISVVAPLFGLSRLDVATGGFSANFSNDSSMSLIFRRLAPIQEKLEKTAIDHVFIPKNDDTVNLSIPFSSLQEAVSIAKYLFETEP